MARATISTTSGGKAASRTRRGLTLVEMLVVLGVIMALAGLVVTLTRHVDSQAKEKSLRNTFVVLKSALQEYYDFTDAFPPQSSMGGPTTRATILYSYLDSVPVSRQALQKLDPSLIQGGGPSGQPLAVYDPWGTAIDYQYKDGDAFPQLLSAGPDKKFGTPDDINSRNL